MKLESVTLEHKGQDTIIRRTTHGVYCDSILTTLRDESSTLEAWIFAANIQAIVTGDDDIFDTIGIFEVINTLRTL